MLITYRRTGGGFLLIMLAAALVAATTLAIVVGATLLIVAVAIGAVALLARAVLPASWRRRAQPAATPWPQETIEAQVVNSRVSSEGSSDERDLLHTGSDKG